MIIVKGVLGNKDVKLGIGKELMIVVVGMEWGICYVIEDFNLYFGRSVVISF